METLSEGAADVTAKERGKTANNFLAHPIKTAPFAPDGIPFLPWSSIGVYRFISIDRTRTVTVTRAQITGKVMNCAGILTQWLPSWSMSKRDQ